MGSAAVYAVKDWSGADTYSNFNETKQCQFNLVATSTSTSEISLSWDAVENALSYNIYQNGELIGQQKTDYLFCRKP